MTAPLPEAALITNERLIEYPPANGREFTLEELYTALGCRQIETVWLGDERVGVLDEHGKLDGREYNWLGTSYCRVHGAIPPEDWIAGPLLVCPRRMLD